MFLFGHMGIGNALLGPWKKGLRYRWILLGTLLPDLIDKPLYYGLSWATGKRGYELGLISGSRTLGHTALMLLAISCIALVKRSRAWAAVAAGYATHLMLDNTGDAILGHGPLDHPTILLWPFLGYRFPEIPFRTLHEHLQTFGAPFLFGAEIVGLLLLSWEFWKTRHENEVLAHFRARRSERHRAKYDRKHGPASKPETR